MRFRFTPEHDDLRAGLRRYVTSAAGPAAALRLAGSASGEDADVLSRLTSEFGIFSLAVPEEFGGAGFGAVELGVVFAELGRGLVGVPLLSASLASTLLIESRDATACGELLPGVADGSLRLAAAVADSALGWSASTTTTAHRTAGGWELSGTKQWVFDGAAASGYVVSATTTDGLALFIVAAAAAGVAVEPVETIDLTRRVATVHLAQATARRLDCGAGTAAQAISYTADLALVLLAAEQTAIAEACLDLARNWATEREQFGQPIGSFQAIKHKLANVVLEVEASVSASMYALWTAVNDRPGLRSAARIAAVTCGEAATLAAEQNVQVHGGIGATWEHPAHLYLRRAMADRLLFGDVQSQLEALAELIESAVPTP